MRKAIVPFYDKYSLEWLSALGQTDKSKAAIFAPLATTTTSLHLTLTLLLNSFTIM